MPLSVTSFSAFAGLLLAAREDADASGHAALARGSVLAATPLAREMARRAEEIALHFTHPGKARDDALAVFWQVAPLCFAGPAPIAGDPATVTEGMVAAVRASGLSHDFRATVLAEPLFRQIVQDALTVMQAAPPR